MGRTACTEPQCLYKGDLYLYLILQYLSHNVPWSVSEPLSINVPHIDSFDLCTHSHKTCPTWKYRLSVWIAVISERTSHYCRQATYLKTIGRPDGMQGKYGYIWSAFVSLVCCCLKLLMLAPVGLVQIRQPSFVSRGCEWVTDTNEAVRSGQAVAPPSYEQTEVTTWLINSEKVSESNYYFLWFI